MLRHSTEIIYATFFDEQLITLDLISDKYTIYSSENSRESAKPFTKIDQPLKIEINNKNIFFGIKIPCWKLKIGDLGKFPNILLLTRSIFLLRKIHAQAKINRLDGLLKILNENSKIHRSRNYSTSEIKPYVQALNLACLFFHKKTKCLEWACTLILLLSHFGIKSNLVIGIQNRPFYAHAWVEDLRGFVIGDDPQRRSQLSVILDTAILFRR
jgi:hypothetical protein